MGGALAQAAGGYGMTCLWGIVPPLMAASTALPRKTQRSTLHPAALALAFAASVGVPACWLRTAPLAVVLRSPLSSTVLGRRGAGLPGQERRAAWDERRCCAQPADSIPVAVGCTRRAVCPCPRVGVAACMPPCNSLVCCHWPAMPACQRCHAHSLWLPTPLGPACAPLHVVGNVPVELLCTFT